MLRKDFGNPPPRYPPAPKSLHVKFPFAQPKFPKPRSDSVYKREMFKKTVKSRSTEAKRKAVNTLFHAAKKRKVGESGEKVSRSTQMKTPEQKKSNTRSTTPKTPKKRKIRRKSSGSSTAKKSLNLVGEESKCMTRKQEVDWRMKQARKSHSGKKLNEWNEEDMAAAVEEFHSTHCSMSSLIEKYKLPYHTFRRRCIGEVAGVKHSSGGKGKPRALSKGEEKMLANCTREYARKGFAVSSDDLCCVA